MEKREERTVNDTSWLFIKPFRRSSFLPNATKYHIETHSCPKHCYWLTTKKGFFRCLSARQVCWIKDEQVKKAIITRTRRESKYSSFKSFCFNRSRCNFRFSSFFVYRLAMGSWFANDEKKTRRNYGLEHGSNCLPVAHNRFTDLSTSIYTWTLSIPWNGFGTHVYVNLCNVKSKSQCETKEIKC